MDEAREILDRLDRIERLEAAGAGPAELLVELRALLVEATAWTRAERAGEEVVGRLRSALLRDIVEG